MPDFVRREPISHKTWLVHYSDADPSRVATERLTDPASSLPVASLSGCGSVEIKLTKLLASTDDRT